MKLQLCLKIILNTEKIWICEGDLYKAFEPLERADAGTGYLLDVTERNTLPEQGNFLLVLVLVGIIALMIGGWSAHLDPFPAASGDVLVPA